MRLSHAIENLIDYLKNKSVLILGFGREGRSTYALLRRFLPEKPLGIADSRVCKTGEDPFVTTYFGENYLDALSRYEICIKSPGIPFRGVSVPESCAITCQMDLFLRFAECTKIGVTGTKGKTTTSTLIYRFLREAGLSACLIGNIGVPVFEDLSAAESTIAVIEMSSHQLQYTSSSPHVAMLTNIYEEHLDHYDGGFQGYVNAKLNIVRHQKKEDYFIYNADQGIDDFLNKKTIKSNLFPVSVFASDPFLRSLAGISPYLKGKHNLQDIYFAVAAARRFGVDDEAILTALKAYEGIEHRMEFVGKFRDIDFYNDSIATIPHAVLCALDALGNVGTLILGGHDRGLHYEDFAADLAAKKLPNIICLPETGHIIGKLLEKAGALSNIFYVSDLPEAVKTAYTLTPRNTSCILSPAASSYNVYRDFEEKGQHFKQLVREMGK
ncbi:MAG: UDP-N-acetylmuramoyl-L-alanine--D-glutamate ligase [Oscillospiraceae bacterium]|jgi:UDP-N-acetylmuramoylalanine--D-glutamate ligase|nr:UDP-N-acetylmuramoyl-L-alanine--D-glutamate ligase [Oscillospiraceae bacterium]